MNLILLNNKPRSRMLRLEFSLFFMSTIKTFCTCKCSHISVIPVIAWDIIMIIDTLFIGLLSVCYSPHFEWS